MSKKYFSNRRITFRDRVSIMGKITIFIKDKTYSENIEIEDITYDGIKIVFSNNDFLFRYLELYKNPEAKIITEFEFNNEKYSFKNEINWFRIYDMAEKDYYVLSSLNFVDKKSYEKILIDLIASIQMEYFYIAKLAK
jgi:hypothetical protein